MSPLSLEVIKDRRKDTKLMCWGVRARLDLECTFSTKRRHVPAWEGASGKTRLLAPKFLN